MARTASYSTKAELKPILDIKIRETTYDTELDNCLKAAYAWVNNILKKHGFSVPLSSPDDTVVYAEAYKAASIYRRRRAPPAEINALIEQAKDFLTVYIEAEKEGTLKRT